MRAGFALFVLMVLVIMGISPENFLSGFVVGIFIGYLLDIAGVL